jgi:hypothetical protein
MSTNDSSTTTTLSSTANVDTLPESIVDNASAITSHVDQPQQQNIFDKLRGADIDLLKLLHVNSIVNLMVEKKKVMFGVK